MFLNLRKTQYAKTQRNHYAGHQILGLKNMGYLWVQRNESKLLFPAATEMHLMFNLNAKWKLEMRALMRVLLRSPHEGEGT